MGRLLRRLRAWWLFQDYIKRGDEGGWLISPPGWMRHIVPWWFLNWLNDHTDVCWANIVMWKMFGGERSWWPSRICFEPHDYCGKFEGKRPPEYATEVLITFAEKK